MAGWVTGGYPGGSVQLEAGDDFAWKQAPCKLVLHSTETANFPDYARNKAPQVTVNPWIQQWRQHRRLDQPAWALRYGGGVSTNSMGAIQVEIVGYAATLKDISGTPLNYLIGFLQFIMRETGIPVQCTVLFGGVETSGTNGARRMSAAQWTNYKGICGHQHVPDNSHWDPGDLPMQAIWLPRLKGVQPAPTPVPEPEPAPIPQEDKMLAFAKDPDDPRIWVGDGVTRRWVESPQELEDIKYKIDTGVLKGNTTVHVGRVGWLGTPVPFAVEVDTEGIVVQAEISDEDKTDLVTRTANATVEKMPKTLQ